MIRVEIIRKVNFSGRVGEEELLKLVFGLREIEVATFRTVIVSKGTVDVESVARRIGRDRTTAQRSLCNLVSAGLVLRTVKPHRRLYYTYEAVSEEKIKEALREYVRKLHRELSQSVEESF
ncbi:MAG: helix-turn-helix domain-containing protein [archaeon]